MRPVLAQPFIHRGAIHPRHAQVAQDQRIILRGQVLQRRLAGIHYVAIIALAAQHVGQQAGDLGLVIQHQRRLARAQHRDGGFLLVDGLARTMTRQADDETRPAARRFLQRQRAAMHFHDPARHGQTDAHADPRRLGGEERIEDLAAQRLRHAGPVIGNVDAHEIAVKPRRNTHAARLWPCLQHLAGIDQQIAQHLVELVMIARHARQVVGDFALHRHPTAAQAIGQQLQRRLYGGRDRHRLDLAAVLPRQCQKAAHDPPAALGRGLDAVGAADQRRRQFAGFLAQHHGVADDNR